MFHAQIAQRAFNTPLLVEPSKAMAFLSGLGPRITDSLTDRPNACDYAVFADFSVSEAKNCSRVAI